MWVIRGESLDRCAKLFLFDSDSGSLQVEIFPYNHKFSYNFEEEVRVYQQKHNVIIPEYRAIPYSTCVSNGYSAPIKIYVDITNSCNMNCMHCLNQNLHSEHQLSISDISAIAQECFDNGVFFVKLGGGEPLMHPEIRKIIENFRKKGVFLSLSTNGFFVTEELATFLSKNSVRTTISLEGPEELDELIRGEGHFDVARNALRILQRQGANVCFRVTLTSKLLDVDAIMRLKELAINEKTKIKFAYCKPSGMAIDNELIMDSSQKQTYREIIQLLNEGREQGFFVIENGMTIRQDNYFQRLYYNDKGCGAGTRTMHIDAEGHLSPCVFLDHSFKHDRKYEFGDIMHFWKGEINPSVEYLRNLPFPSECYSCVRNCKGQCVALRLYHTGNVLGTNPNCLTCVKENVDEL